MKMIKSLNFKMKNLNDFINIFLLYPKFQNAMPIRIKGLHFINVPSIAYPVLQICRFFLREKIKARVNIFG